MLVKARSGNPILEPEGALEARFNFALFIDDICLVPLDHMQSPVVKILHKQWGHLTPEERKYEVHSDFHDGATEDEEEDVRWMYMSVLEYVDIYDKYEWAHDCAWYASYLRPPQMVDYWGDEGSQPGFWRTQETRKKMKHQESEQ
jgi:hypothetical protein